jgi:hypothetical protein
VSLFADTVLRASWNKVYFTIGIPIFWMRVPVGKNFKGIPHQYLFEEEFKGSWFAPPLTFKENDSHSFFFCEKFFELPLRYWPIMHGRIFFEHDKNRVIVKGLANWFTLWIAINVLLAVLNAANYLQLRLIEPVILAAFLFVAFYLIQWYRFSKVGKFAAELCSNKHFLNNGGV